MREMASNVLVADVFRMIAWMNVSLNANTFVRVHDEEASPSSSFASRPEAEFFPTRCSNISRIVCFRRSAVFSSHEPRDATEKYARDSSR